MTIDHVVVEADGGARGNPGVAGFGAVVREPDSGAVLLERLGFLGVTTNNVAEYTGLIAGLTAAAELGAREVDVRMDSKLVVEQMSGRWQIKHPGLRPLAAQAAKLVSGFDTVRFTWIPRERNKLADALANKAMDERVTAPAGSTRSAGSTASAPVPATGAASPAKSAGSAAATASGSGGAAGRSWEPRLGPPTRLILVRHGETELNGQGRYSGRGDVPLSERGRAQARVTATRLAGLASGTAPIAAVVSSPLARATGTARMLAAAVHNPPVPTDPDLIECDFGVWEGRTFAEVREGWPAELAAWLASPAVAPPGGESFDQVSVRVAAAVDRLRQRYQEKTVVVVSHVTPIKITLRDALAAGDDFLHRLYLDPAGISIVDSWPDGGIAVRSVNDTAHLAAIV